MFSERKQAAQKLQDTAERAVKTVGDASTAIAVLAAIAVAALAIAAVALAVVVHRGPG